MLTVLNVVIGIVFIYLIFSLVVSAANEVILSLLGKRKDFLWKGIDELLQDRESRVSSKGRPGPSKEFSNHPLIMALSDGAKGLPSYIPSKMFVATMIDLLKTGRLGSAPDSQSLGDLVAMIQNAGLQRALNALLTEANGDLDAFKAKLEEWFNDAMDRVSGWYKRCTQYWLVGIAMVLAIACNIDSIHILLALSSDPKLSQSLVDVASQQIKNQSPPQDLLKEDPTKLPMNLKAFRDDLELLRGLSLPIGWGGTQPDYFAKQRLTTILGWILTALAASLGAPFWFDTLSRIVNVRAAGKVPGRQTGTDQIGSPRTSTASTTADVGPVS
jgi:hypothetical protein